jgi:arsenate reductase-like glutaredoxin family protein
MKPCSAKAQLYKSMNLKDKSLTEEDYKKYILEHYIFLSRPVLSLIMVFTLAEPNKTCLKS